MQEQRNEIQIAWAAGLFEGEGFMGAYQRRYGAKIQSQMGLGSTDYDVVEHFAQIVGCGALHRVKPGTGGHKPLLVWKVYEAAEVRRVIALFLPHLRDRRRAKALEVLDAIQDVRSHNEKKTHCPRGHELSGDNLELERLRRPTLHKPDREYFARHCRTCRREQARNRKRRELNITPDRYRIPPEPISTP